MLDNKGYEQEGKPKEIAKVLWDCFVEFYVEIFLLIVVGSCDPRSLWDLFCFIGIVSVSLFNSADYYEGGWSINKPFRYSKDSYLNGSLYCQTFSLDNICKSLIRLVSFWLINLRIK
jgi:hypothetical protein